ncbi:MAG: response regulator [Limisphaerales bacterium]|jgi:two-component system invasion response regulator UvrY
MKRFLIIDDHEVVRRGLRGMLLEAHPGGHFGEAPDSRAAMALLVGEAWDLVLLDINLPGRSGLEVLADIKKLRPDLPVVVLSVYPEADYAVRAIRMGAAGYLTKQMASDELLKAVGKALEGGKYVTATLAETLARTLGGEVSVLPHESLSARELQVLRLLVAGRSLKEIAYDLGLSEKTIGTYRGRISDKMGLRTNVELTRYAMQHGLAE